MGLERLSTLSESCDVSMFRFCPEDVCVRRFHDDDCAFVSVNKSVAGAWHFVKERHQIE